MELPFIKIENAGNDYIYVRREAFVRTGLKTGVLARRISDRYLGAGSDGLIIVDIKGPGAAAIRIFNKDGSEAELCGNGLRGTVLFIKKVAKTGRHRFTVSTRWNRYDLRLVESDRNSTVVEHTLGQPSFDSRDVGLSGGEGTCMGVEVAVGQNKRTVYCVAMPNPHAVIFVDNFDFDWQKEGVEIEHSPLFKNKTNVMFARVDTNKKITVVPWERGSGATRACGSGAAAVTVVSRMLGYTGPSITVSMPGGKLSTTWDLENNEIRQSGPSRVVLSGSYSI